MRMHIRRGGDPIPLNRILRIDMAVDPVLAQEALKTSAFLPRRFCGVRHIALILDKRSDQVGSLDVLYSGAFDRTQRRLS